MGLHCHDMKKGQIYYCEDCGLEIQIMSECTQCCADEESCSCSFSCCDKDLKLRS